MWQSRIEIIYYSIERITEFDALERWTSAKGGAHTSYVNAWISDMSKKCVWNLPLAEA